MTKSKKMQESGKLHLESEERYLSTSTEIILLQNIDTQDQIIAHRFHLRHQIAINDKWLSTHRVDCRSWFSRSILFIPAFLAILSFSFPTVTSLETCGKRLAIHTIRYNSCLPKNISTPACFGTCHSYSASNPDNLTSTQRSCSCCDALEFRNVSVSLRCPRRNGHFGYFSAVVHYMVPHTCMCRPCDQLSYTVSA